MKNVRGNCTLGTLLIFVVLLGLVVAFISMGGCTNSGEARRLLSAQGYTNIDITGYEWFGCSEDDNLHTGFTATSPNGSRVSGVVCGCMIGMKGSTIRFK